RIAKPGRAPSTGWSGAARSGPRTTSAPWPTTSLASEDRNEKSRRATVVQRDLAARLRAPPRRSRRDDDGRARGPRLGDGDRPDTWRATGLARIHQAVSGHGWRGLRRAAHRLRRQIRVRQLGERGRALLRR